MSWSEFTELLLRDFSPVEQSFGDLVHAFSVKCGQMWIIFSFDMKKFQRESREEQENEGEYGRMLTFPPIAYPCNASL